MSPAEQPSQERSLEEISSAISRIIAEEDRKAAAAVDELPNGTVRSVAALIVSAPRWPLVAAPVVGLVYYLASWSAFVTAMVDIVVFSRSELDQRHGGAVVWGTHWVYRLLAEGISIAFATFVAGGMARERATTAALIGGLGISLLW